MKVELYFKANKDNMYYEHLKDYGQQYKIRDEFIRAFCKKHNIEGESYSTGFCGGNNKPPKENEKKSIYLGVEATDYQILPVAKHFNKEQCGVRYLSKRSPLLKEFQKLVVEQGIMLNLYRFSPIEWFTRQSGERYQWNYLMNEEEVIIKLLVCEEWGNLFEQNAKDYELEPCTEETWNKAFFGGYRRVCLQ